MSKEEILAAFYGTDHLRARRQGLDDAVRPEQFKGKLTNDLIDADTGEVKAAAGERMTPRARQAAARGGSKHDVLAPTRS
jgi:hypothetical protein